VALLRRSVCVIALLAFYSCATLQGEPSPDGFGAVSQSEREEYEQLARLEEHPLDPMKARGGDLLMIPGFPKRLAERIVELRAGTGSVSTLIGRLTPPERAALYRFESYLLLPDRRPVRWETRFTVVEREEEHKRLWDLRTDLRSQRYRVLARSRPDGVYRFYLSGGGCRGYLRLHAGDFTPDLAWGLVSSSYHTSYPFSSGYTIRRCGWIAGTSSFYSPSIRGGAVETWMGGVRLLLFRGKECGYYNGRLFIRADHLSGMRCEADFEEARAGVSICAGPRLPEGRAVSLDFGLERGVVEMQCELVLFGKNATEGVCAIEVDGSKNDLGLLFRGNGLSAASRFGRSFHGLSGPKRGLSAVARHRLLGRMELLSAFERWSSWNGRRDDSGDLIRIELRRRGKVSVTKLSYSWRRDSECGLMPSPPHEDAAVGVKSSANLLQSFNLNGSTRLRISVRMPLEKDRGILVAPSILLDRPVKAALSYAWHRSYSGIPLFYLYEPTVRGFYPWRSLRGDGWRISALCEMSTSLIRFSSSFCVDGSGEREGTVQMSVVF
jgi:hypothetical protein